MRSAGTACYINCQRRENSREGRFPPDSHHKSEQHCFTQPTKYHVNVVDCNIFLVSVELIEAHFEMRSAWSGRLYKYRNSRFER